MTMHLPWLPLAACLCVSAAVVRADWRSEADARIERLRKGDFEIVVRGPDGKPLPDAQVTLRQVRHHFGFGSTVHGNPESADPFEQRYFQFIADHFSLVVCENWMKWYEMEEHRDIKQFEPADRLLRWAKRNDLPMRGHCLFWSKPKWNRPWVNELPAAELRLYVDRHLDMMVRRYKGQLACWDVYNEILNGQMFEDKLGPDIRPYFWKRAAELDGATPLFTNEYSILGIDQRVEQYVQLVRQLQAAGAPVGGIGVQDHGLQRFAVTDPPATGPATHRAPSRPGPRDILRSLDRLGELGLPIHMTEVSSITEDEELRADTLEMFFRVCFSHPRVEAIVLWGFHARRHFKQSSAALIDANWDLLPAGKRIFPLLQQEWRTNLSARTDAAGAVSFRGFHGTYEVATTAPDGAALTATVRLSPGAPATAPCAVQLRSSAPPSTRPGV